MTDYNSVFIKLKFTFAFFFDNSYAYKSQDTKIRHEFDDIHAWSFKAKASACHAQ